MSTGTSLTCIASIIEVGVTVSVPPILALPRKGGRERRDAVVDRKERAVRNQETGNAVCSAPKQQAPRHKGHLRIAVGHAALRLSLRSLIARTLPCRNHSFSDGVSIRGAFEVTGVGLCEAVVAIAEFLSPPSFKVVSMFISDRLNQRRSRAKLSGIAPRCGPADCASLYPPYGTQSLGQRQR